MLMPSNSKFKIIVVVVFLMVIFGLSNNFTGQVSRVLSKAKISSQQWVAIILSHNFKSVTDIRIRYDLALTNSTAKKVNILIVPGHEPNFGGAEFGNLKERDLVVALAQELEQLLRNNPHYQVFVTRDNNNWNPILASYFKDNWNEIIDWRKNSYQEMSRLKVGGLVFIPATKISHSNAQPEVATRLWGINKWANENDIDIVLHLHFNDYPRSSVGRLGKYSGFSIYVPVEQYGNSSTTKAIADDIFNRLAKYNPISDLPGEDVGIIDEPDLIAIGAKNSSNSGSLLIEYGYIYEPQLTNPELRDVIIKDLAFQTYLGLQDFFEPDNPIRIANQSETLLLPHNWERSFDHQDKNISTDVLALQTVLMSDGVYPPVDKSKNDCPRTGIFGPCTRSALVDFQIKYGITGESGLVGEKTISVLRQLD